MPDRWDFTIKQGAQFTRTFVYEDDAGAPINLTGCTARMQFRDGFEATSPIFDLTETSGITIDGPSGTITFTLTKVQTAGVAVDSRQGDPPGRPLNHDFFLTWPDGVSECLFEGTGTVTRSVTRA